MVRIPGGRLAKQPWTSLNQFISYGPGTVACLKITFWVGSTSASATLLELRRRVQEKVLSIVFLRQLRRPPTMICLEGSNQ